ncbi:MAG TPA: hypothetical protein VGA97_03535 [Acidimicrobiia bacterium]
MKVDVEWLSLLAAGLFVWMALVHLLMAGGLRMGELVWSGRYPRRLHPSYRRRSLGYAILLLLSAWVVAAFGGTVDVSPVPAAWSRSAGWVVTAFLSIAAIYNLFQGTRWERFIFLPITVFGASLAGWLTFG